MLLGMNDDFSRNGFAADFECNVNYVYYTRQLFEQLTFEYEQQQTCCTGRFLAQRLEHIHSNGKVLCEKSTVSMLHESTLRATKHS